MNLIDGVVLTLIILYALNGLYRGFVPSILNLGGFFLSWIFSFLFYPLLSSHFINTGVFTSFKFYIEGAERIGDFELAKMPVAGITDVQLERIMQGAKMPPPFNTAIVSNIKAESFAHDGLATLGEYFDTTIFNVIVNIISLLIIFAALRILFTLLTNAYSYAVPLPQLRHFDYPMGAAIGLLRGFFSMYLLFAIIPIALILLPISFVTDIVNSSAMSKVFYEGSVLLRFISGVI